MAMKDASNSAVTFLPVFPAGRESLSTKLLDTYGEGRPRLAYPARVGS